MTAAPLHLTKRPLEVGAIGCFIQVGHRRDAIAYALAGIDKQYQAIVASWGGDASGVEAMMRDWVVETLLQGAYVREYHLWEKDCRAYFRSMAERNGSSLVEPNRKRPPFPAIVQEWLASFGLEYPSGTLDVMLAMCRRLRAMKHDPGLEIEHFITAEDYERAMSAIERFWNHLASQEQVRP